MVELITGDDLRPFIGDVGDERLISLIEDATAFAVQAAPCLRDTTDAGTLQLARAVLRAAIVRWHASDFGTVTSSQVSIADGSVTDRYGERTTRAGLLWPSEVAALQAACAGPAVSSGARMGWLC